jgi:hypothetical protein
MKLLLALKYSILLPARVDLVGGAMKAMSGMGLPLGPPAADTTGIALLLGLLLPLLPAPGPMGPGPMLLGRVTGVAVGVGSTGPVLLGEPGVVLMLVGVSGSGVGSSLAPTGSASSGVVLVVGVVVAGPAAARGVCRTQGENDVVML